MYSLSVLNCFSNPEMLMNHLVGVWKRYPREALNFPCDVYSRQVLQEGTNKGTEEQNTHQFWSLVIVCSSPNPSHSKGQVLSEEIYFCQEDKMSLTTNLILTLHIQSLPPVHHHRKKRWLKA